MRDEAICIVEGSQPIEDEISRRYVAPAAEPRILGLPGLNEPEETEEEEISRRYIWPAPRPRVLLLPWLNDSEETEEEEARRLVANPQDNVRL